MTGNSLPDTERVSVNSSSIILEHTIRHKVKPAGNEICSKTLQTLIEGADEGKTDKTDF